MVRIIEVEDRRIAKPFLGGWRHTVNGTEYLNAESQTGPLPKRVSWENCCSIGVQCVDTKDEVVQLPHHRATQMSRPDCYISSVADKYKTPKRYETYAEMMVRLNFDGNARIIQKNYRLYRLFKYMKESAREYRRLVEKCRRYHEERIAIYRKRYEWELYRKLHPQTRLDFDMLYSLIDQWRRDCLKKIGNRYFRGSKSANNCLLLAKTTQLINAVDKHRQRVKEEWRKKNRLKFLAVNTPSVKWHGYKDKLVEMVTLKNQKAREYVSMYEALNRKPVSIEDRMEVLITLRKSLEPHTCVAVFELLYLLNQEILLLSRSIENLSLEYLRERILCDYLRFLRTYCGCVRESEQQKSTVYYQECERMQKPLEVKTALCKSCRKVLPYSRFSPHSGNNKLSCCTGCTWLREWSYHHVNYDPYIFILNCLRAEEKRKKCFSALTFMMQPRDMYYLVNHIWHGHSAISKCDNLHALRFVRYRQEEEWSPWNCILLTNEEAEIHNCVKDFNGFYSQTLLHQILLKHLTAKSYFRQLSKFDKDFRESGRFYRIEDREKYEPRAKINLKKVYDFSV